MELSANMFEEIAELSKQHEMEMFQKQALSETFELDGNPAVHHSLKPKSVNSRLTKTTAEK